MKSPALKDLESAIHRHLDENGPRRALPDLGIFSCYLPQKIRSVPFETATALLVINGHKELSTDSRSFTLKEGEIMMVPAGTRFLVGNHPSASGARYLGLALHFTEAAIDQFRQIYGALLEEADLAPQWKAPAPAAVLSIVSQWADWGLQHESPPELARHRQVELLLLLARAGLAGNLLIRQQASWQLKVRQHLALDPARNWQIREICNRVGVSESALRRHLQDEGTGFRDILEEVRLNNGLTLIWDTGLSIARVAEASGYQSQSRFTERFKGRFGTTPSELRRTMIQGDAPPPIRAAAE